MVVERIGQHFAGYRLLRLLGQGGFAEVYLGEHVHLGTQVAVKILHTRLIAHKQEQFLREARTIASLDHPGIVSILDCGVENGVPFLIMTYAPHGSLRQRYPDGTCLPIADILSYVRPIASVLSYAHERRLIHRDIKPENILLDARKEVLLSDFGIAVVSSTSVAPDTKEVAGTIAYMAPEQIMGKPRAASDQYALGVVVYEWLCGELPFHGTFIETCTQHLYAPPPPLREKNPELPVALENVVFKALAKEPLQRFASIQDFAEALEECVRPSAPHHYSTIRILPEVLAASLVPASLNAVSMGKTVSTRRRLLWLCITAICLLATTLVVLAPAFLKHFPSTKTPALISLSAHTYQQPLVKAQLATPVPMTTAHSIPQPASPTTSDVTQPTATPSAGSISSSAIPKATSGSLKPVLVIPTPLPTITAHVVTPLSPTPIPPLQLQVSPRSLTPQECSHGPEYWECTVTLSTSGSGSDRLHWSMAITGGVAGVTTTILHGRLTAGENRTMTIYIPDDPFAGNCASASLIFDSSANTVIVPWNCP